MKQLHAKHPRAIRWFHWINVPLLGAMIWSGWLIYWANDVYRVMRDVCKHLTDAEIAGLAAYYSGTAGKPPAVPTPAAK